MPEVPKGRAGEEAREPTKTRRAHGSGVMTEIPPQEAPGKKAEPDSVPSALCAFSFGTLSGARTVDPGFAASTHAVHRSASPRDSARFPRCAARTGASAPARAALCASLRRAREE